MFQIEECIQNDDKALKNTKNTTINLAKGGDNFFMAHIEERERYESLVDIWTPFIDRTVSKTKQEGFNEIADRLGQNKDKFKQYLASKGIKTLDQLQEMAEQRYYEKLGYTNLQQPDYLTKALLEVSRCVRSIQVKNRFKIYQVNEGLEIESSSFSFFKLAVGFWDAFSGYKALLDFFLDIYVTKIIYDANQDK